MELKTTNPRATAIHEFLSGLVDYAGLFPPAGLSLIQTVRNYAGYLNSDDRWMLGRLIVPASQLAELAELVDQGIGPAGNGHAWRISALVPEYDRVSNGLQQSLQGIDSFNERSTTAVVDAIEGKISSLDRIAPTIELLSGSLAAFLEVPIDQAATMVPGLASHRQSHLRAKVRTGGVIREMIPPARAIAEFLRACADAKMPFKATAGLHHPLRDRYPLTYADDAPRHTMHGFLNVFVAACLAWSHQAPVDQLVRVLDSGNPGQFRFRNDGLEWEDMFLSTREIADSRRRFALSFGSCSFLEPTTEIRRPGWME